MAQNDLGQFPGESTAKVRYFILRYLPYLPLIIILMVAGFISGSTYIRYSHHIYEVKAKIILPEDQNQSKNDQQSLLRLKLEGEGNGSQEQAFELLQSNKTMNIVVNSLGLYAEILNKGRLITSKTYSPQSPIKVLSPYPEKILEEFSIPISIHYNKNEVCLNKLCYPTGKIVQTPYGELEFELNRNYSFVEPNDEFILHLIPTQDEAANILSNMRVLAKSKESNIVEIYMQDELTARSSDIIHKMIMVFDSLSAIKQKEANVNIISFIDNRLKVVSDDLKKIEKELQNFKSSLKAENLTSKSGAYFNRIQELGGEISLSENQIKILDQVESALKIRNKTHSSIPSIVELTNVTLTGQLLQLFSEEDALDKQIKLSGEKNPQTIFLEERIEKLKIAIIESIENLKKTYLISQNSVKKELDKYNQLLGTLPNQERQLLDITRKQEVKNSIYTFLLQKREEVALNSAAIYSNTIILEEPNSPDLISPIISQIYLTSVLAALAIAIGLIALNEAYDNTIKSRAEIERVLSVPIVGEISRIPKMDPKKPIVIGKELKTIFAEQFRSLRTNLNYLGLDSQRKVIMVTSSIVNEGKSFVALNMAIAISLSGKKVVLMDFDLRKPKLSRQFSELPPIGITNYLVGNSNIEDIFHELPDYPNLSFAPSGAIPPNPSEIILGKNMKVLMEYVIAHFDYIILDSPPVGIITDAKLLAPYADLCLYVIRHGVTPTLFLRYIETLHLDKILPNMGLLINDLKSRKLQGYSYDYQYAYSFKEKELRWDQKLMNIILKNSNKSKQ